VLLFPALADVRAAASSQTVCRPLATDEGAGKPDDEIREQAMIVRRNPLGDPACNQTDYEHREEADARLIQHRILFHGLPHCVRSRLATPSTVREQSLLERPGGAHDRPQCAETEHCREQPDEEAEKRNEPKQNEDQDARQ
jgi:hypothetical protein